MPKKQFQTSQEITIPRVWLKGLLQYAERTKKLSKNHPEQNLKIALPALLGYISSAKTILKYKKQSSPRIPAPYQFLKVKSMYSPKLRNDQIKKLYKLAKLKDKPMTILLRDAVDEYLKRELKDNLYPVSKEEIIDGS